MSSQNGYIGINIGINTGISIGNNIIRISIGNNIVGINIGNNIIGINIGNMRHSLNMRQSLNVAGGACPVRGRIPDYAVDWLLTAA